MRKLRLLGLSALAAAVVTLTASAQIELYRGDGAAAWQHIVEQWPAMASSALLHVECVRIFMVHLRARCALAAAASAADPEPLLKVVRQDARKLEREKPSWCRCMPLMLRARVAWEHDWTNNAALAATFQAAQLPGAPPGAPVAFQVNGAGLPANSALASASAELRVTRWLSLLAKLDTEFAGSSQTYAGTATVRVSW